MASDADAHPGVYTISIKQDAQKCKGRCERTMNTHRRPRAVLPASESEKRKMFLLKVQVKEC